MTRIEIDLDEYVSEFSERALVAELRRRNAEIFQQINYDFIDKIIALLDLGRWNEALDALNIARREGAPLTKAEMETMKAKYCAAIK